MRHRWRQTQAAAVALVMGLLVALAPRPARAEENADYSSVYAVLAGLVAADLFFTGYDVFKAAQGERASSGMATAEIAVAAPQFAIGTLFLVNAKGSDKTLTGGYVLWTAVLMAHGIAALTLPASGSSAPASPPSAPASPPGRPPHASPSFTLAPTVLSDGMQSSLVPGLGASGRF